MNDVELRDILADLLPHVRTDHVIPVDSDILTGAIKRGLISVPPSHMIGSDVAATAVAGGRSSASAWVRTRNTSLFVRPRLFTPYYDEVKVCISLLSYMCYRVVSYICWPVFLGSRDLRYSVKGDNVEGTFIRSLEMVDLMLWSMWTGGFAGLLICSWFEICLTSSFGELETLRLLICCRYSLTCILSVLSAILTLNWKWH